MNSNEFINLETHVPSGLDLVSSSMFNESDVMETERVVSCYDSGLSYKHFGVTNFFRKLLKDKVFADEKKAPYIIDSKDYSF